MVCRYVASVGSYERVRCSRQSAQSDPYLAQEVRYRDRLVPDRKSLENELRHQRARPAWGCQAGLARRQCERARKQALLRFRERTRSAGARTIRDRDAPSRHAPIQTARRVSKRKSLREEFRDVSLLPSRGRYSHGRGRALERAGELSQLLRRGARIADLGGRQHEGNAPPLEQTGDGLRVIAYAKATLDQCGDLLSR